MKASRNVMAWFVAFLLLISSVYAAEDTAEITSGEDFTASGTARILAFSCSPAYGQIIVTNTGAVPSSYGLVAEGGAKEWVAFDPMSFVLMPGQSQAVNEYFSLPCDAEDSSLEVAIQTDELELVLVQEILAQTPNNLVLAPVAYSKEILPCDAADFVFVLHNPAEFAETYSLKVTDSPDETTISDTTLTLEPHTNETIAITVYPKDCTLSGDFTPVLQVQTEKSKIMAEIEMYLHINSSDIPIIGEGIDKIRALVEPQEAQIEIVNTGDRQTAYTLLLEGGASWITVQPQQISIAPRTSENVKLVLQPTETTAQGSYPIKLTAIVDKTGKEYTKEITIILKNPTFADKLFREYLVYTIAAIIVLIVLLVLIVKGIKKYNSPESKARRAEKRAERQRLREERAAKKEAERKAREEEKERQKKQKEKEEQEKEKEEERRLREIERERARAQKEYEKELRRENLIISKDEIVSGLKVPGKKLLKLLVLLIVLAVVVIGIVYGETLGLTAQIVVAGIILLLFLMLIHRMRRQRHARAKWKLALANKVMHFETKWKKGLNEVAFKLNTVVEKLTVSARKCRPTVPPYSDCVYQTFVLDSNVEKDMVSDVRVRFKISKSWMLRHNVAPSSVKLLHLGTDRWDSIVAEPVSTDGKYVYFAADAEGFGEFAIIGKQGKKAKKERKLGKWVLPAIIVIVALIALVSLAIVIQVNRTPTIGIPAQVWKQDTQYTLDLDQFFKDPDGDVLLYSSSPTENIEVMFAGGKAVFTPHYGWSGTERVVFTADDGKGGIVKSNAVELIVEPDVIPAYWKRHAGSIFGLAVLVLVILGVIFYRKQLKRLVGLE
jgi:PGF-pre-PGF domain-containing protein